MRLLRPASWHPQVRDAVVGALLLAFLFVAAVADDGTDRPEGRQDTLDLAAFAAALVLLTLRRRWPLPVFAVSTGLAVLSVTSPWLLPPAALTCLICAYTV